MKQKKKGKVNFKKIGAISTLALAATGAFFVLTTNKNKPLLVPAYTAARVLDGDTFETQEKQLIRLASVEAPELGLCGGEEAKEQLAKLVLNKKLYIKVLFRDSYNRLISQVYSENDYVNKAMIASGNAYYLNREKEIAQELKTESDKAREKKLGIFSDTCTQMTNKKNPTCNIKGNTRDKDRYYFLPTCSIYHRALVQLYLGDEWFCTEKEAINAGYVKPAVCK